MKLPIILIILTLTLAGCNSVSTSNQCVEDKDLLSDVKFLMEQSGYIKLKPENGCGGMGNKKCRNKQYSNNALEVEYYNDIECQNGGLSSIEESRCDELQKLIDNGEFEPIITYTLSY